MWTYIAYFALSLLELAVMARAILRPNRDPAARIAWVVVIAVVPGAGMLAYLLIGETSIGRSKSARALEVLDSLPPLPADASLEISDRAGRLFRLGQSVGGFAPVGGNRAMLLADSGAAIDVIVADMDAAREHIHVLFYIWLTDRTGLKVADGLMRAAARGVTCRAMADAMGSRAMIASESWKKMSDAGVSMGIALPVTNPLLRPLKGRIDLRNHRKIVVIDDRITYCGSQNCADPEFLPKAKFAPWVDILVRFEGPIARQNQHVFVSDWMTCVKDDLRHLLEAPMPPPQAGGFVAQVIATGPTMRNAAMHETFVSLMHAAHENLTITTPYYVPNEAMEVALCTAAHRGVKTRIIFPARNDSRIVGAASRSYYRELLDAGVRIYEYAGGLLHTKSMAIDDDILLIGSANMDRRSFELNYENNILLQDAELTARMRERQEEYLASSREVTLQEVDDWSMPQRLIQNTVGMLSPLL